ncbi:hypothetical protein BC938DRAFT_472054 [Jimgerdemannia flammicorona]|uniref:Uncharacterized protein n=1 Tax=Jimgerdemannia flammicorona TaxID=994334 RepID=A0A433Q6V5_9FUNG|nr:hypothetical protein BC938DRAFT_472054 [Jimgerdemannia flammicorona]
MAESNTQNYVIARKEDALTTSIDGLNTQYDVTIRKEDALTTSTSYLPVLKANVNKALTFFENHKKINGPSDVESANIMALVDESGDNYRELISKTVATAKRCNTSAMMIAETLELLAGPKDPSKVLQCLDFYTGLVEQQCNEVKEMYRDLVDKNKATQDRMINFNTQRVKFLVNSKDLEDKSRNLTADARALETPGALAFGVSAAAATTVAVGTGGGVLILGGGLFMYRYMMHAYAEKAGGNDLNFMTYIFSTNIEAKSESLMYKELFRVAQDSSVFLDEVDETLKQIQKFWYQKAEELEEIRRSYENIRGLEVPTFDTISLRFALKNWQKLGDDYSTYVNAFSRLDE